MDQRDRPDEPVEYVGGLADARRPRALPYYAVAFALVILVAAALVFRGSILNAGHTFGESFVPYSLNLTASQWSADDKLTGVPVTLALQVQNADPRTVHGLTVRLVNISRQLEVQSARPDAEIDGTTIFFPQSLAPSKAETLAITFLPAQAGDWRFAVTIAPGRGNNTPARVTTLDGTVTTSLHAEASVRNPTAADALAQVAATWNPQVAVGGTTTWQIQLINDGPITITSVTLGFPRVPAGFELISARPRASVLPDGRLRFVISLPPGGQGTVATSLVAHRAGQFQVPINVYLDDAVDPLASAGGGPIVNLDITVA